MGRTLLLLLTVALWIGAAREAYEVARFEPLVRPPLPSLASSLEHLNRSRLGGLRVRAYAEFALGLLFLLAAAHSSRPRSPWHWSAVVAPSGRNTATVLACAVSAVACALISRIWAEPETARPVGYVPGWIFGLCFSVVNIRGFIRIGLFIIGSGLIYLGAVQVYHDVVYLSEPYFVPGMAAGAFGGAGLAMLTKLLTHRPIKIVDETMCAVLGAILGVPFITFLSVDQFWGMALAFVLWQIPVGLLLATSIERYFVEGDERMPMRVPSSGARSSGT